MAQTYETYTDAMKAIEAVNPTAWITGTAHVGNDVTVVSLENGTQAVIVKMPDGWHVAKTGLTLGMDASIVYGLAYKHLRPNCNDDMVLLGEIRNVLRSLQML